MKNRAAVLIALILAMLVFTVVVDVSRRGKPVNAASPIELVPSGDGERVELAQPESARRAAAPLSLPAEHEVFASYVDTSKAEIERLRLELDECRYPRDTPIGIAHALPEWPKLDDVQRRDVEWFLQAYPIKLAWGEAEFIATYRAPDGGDRLADVIRTLGRARVRATLAPQEQSVFDEMYP